MGERVSKLKDGHASAVYYSSPECPHCRSPARLKRLDTADLYQMIDNSRDSSATADAGPLLSASDKLVRAVEAAGAGLWEWNLPRKEIHVSGQLAELLGLPGEATVLSATAFFNFVDPDDLPLLRVALGDVLKTDTLFFHEFRVNLDDGGEPRWLSFRGQMLDSTDDMEPATLAGLCLDVTNQRRIKEAYELLNRELSHRMKNLLSVVGSLVNMSGEHRPEAKAFVASFQSRLNTLAAAHDLLMNSERHQALPLELLVKQALSPLGVWDRIDVKANQNHMRLGSHDSQTIVLVLHELATNAIKYGALSTPAGRVGLVFTTEAPGGDTLPVLAMTWTEAGGPPVKAPEQRGFGTLFIERLTRRQTSGEAALNWEPQGLRCRVALPVTQPRRQAPSTFL
jgi:two-component sensor histidine kinase